MKIPVLILLVPFSIYSCDKESSSQIAIYGGTPPAAGSIAQTSTVSMAIVKNGSVSPFCSGTLIHPRIVATAKHCIKAVTERDLTTVVYTGSQVRGVRVEDAQKVIAKETTYPDLALLILAPGSSVGSKKPASLLPKEARIDENTPVIEAGYGSTEEGKDSLGTLLQTAVKYVGMTANDEYILASRGGHGACHGDSGGPAYAQWNGRWYLIGATSNGKNNCGNETVTYQNVPAHLAWIKETARKHGINFDEMPDNSDAKEARPIACHEGFSLRKLSSGGYYCSNGGEMHGPFTGMMKEQCIANGGGEGCTKPIWQESFGLGLRGDGICPVGSQLDGRTGYCREGQDALGPFPAAIVSKCERATTNPASCSNDRYNADFLASFVNL